MHICIYKYIYTHIYLYLYVWYNVYANIERQKWEACVFANWLRKSGIHCGVNQLPSPALWSLEVYILPGGPISVPLTLQLCFYYYTSVEVLFEPWIYNLPSHYCVVLSLVAQVSIYSKTSLTDHLHRWATPLYLGPKRLPI